MRVRATVAYDGTDFHGFAANDGVRTVVGELCRVLSLVARCEVELVGAGRTDAGVHARGQVISFDVPDGTDLTRVQRSTNKLLGTEIMLRDLTPAPEGFSARFDASWRRYRYGIDNRPVADPLTARTSWWVPQPLDIDLMRLACDPLIGEHDFTSFCRRPDAEASLVRRVLHARWFEDAPMLTFEIQATAFCHNMVRSIVGLLVEVGRGKRRAGDVAGLLRARDRSRAATVAPAHGLVLEEVAYLASPTARGHRRTADR